MLHSFTNVLRCYKYARDCGLVCLLLKDYAKKINTLLWDYLNAHFTLNLLEFNTVITCVKRLNGSSRFLNPLFSVCVVAKFV